MNKGKRTLGLLLAMVLLLGTAVIPASAAEGTAKAVDYPALIGNQEVTLSAYAVGDTTYLRLRDIAQLLSETSSTFNVTWDGSSTVSVQTGVPYSSANGTELENPFGGDWPYVVNPNRVVVDGQPVSVDAILLTDANGNGYTYCSRESLLEAFHVFTFLIMPYIDGEPAYNWYMHKAEAALGERDVTAAEAYLNEAEKYALEGDEIDNLRSIIREFNGTYWSISLGVTNGSGLKAKFYVDGTFDAVHATTGTPITGRYHYAHWPDNTLSFSDVEGASDSIKAELEETAFARPDGEEGTRFESCEEYLAQGRPDRRSVQPDPYKGYDAVLNGTF